MNAVRFTFYSITGFEAAIVHSPKGSLKLMAKVTY